MWIRRTKNWLHRSVKRSSKSKVGCLTTTHVCHKGRRLRCTSFVEFMCRDLISHRILCMACTSGKHRSATLAIEAAVTLRRAGWAVEEVHLGLLWHEGFWTSKQGLENWLDDLAARVMRTCAVVQAPTSRQYCWCTSFCAECLAVWFSKRCLQV